MLNKILIFLIVICAVPSAAQHKIGVRAGLNYSTFSGELEPGEDYGIASGFHFGINYTYEFNDIMGVRGELLYTQRGSKHSYYSENNYNIIKPINSPQFVDFGEVDLNMVVSNSYLSIPVTVQLELSRKIELFGGMSVDFLIGPSGRGKLDYTSNENPDDIFYIQSYDHRYGSDTTGQFNRIIQQSQTISIIVDGDVVELPRIVGAYYNFTEEQKTGKRFNGLDAHLIIGGNYFINPGFYIGVRAEYGLNDITNNEMDFSLKELNTDGTYIFRDDFDRSLSLNVSFGFKF